MSFNDISLTSGMRSNLVNLQATVSLLNRTQERLSTGKKVNSALDDPTAYFAAQSLNGRASDLSSLKDGMGQAIQAIAERSSGEQEQRKPRRIGKASPEAEPQKRQPTYKLR